MDVSANTWNTLSELLDEALDLEPAARAVWFEQLSVTQPALAPSVRQLLAAHASSETADVLARLPTLDSTAAAVKRVSALAPGDRIGPYRLKRELGAGGMADVWLAERADGAFTREVALKLPVVNRLRRDLAARFTRERDILARLEHPHIARFYDAGITADGLSYLAMEYVNGEPITTYCDKQRLDVGTRLRLFVQVLDAVQFAHANLIIHRDLKPSNILVTTDGQVRLLDFGIAKLLEGEAAHETQLTQLAGRAMTPDYASPEQIKGEPLTIATDVFSLGVVLYELLAGQRPYKLKLRSVAQLEHAIVTADAVKLSAAIAPEAANIRGTTAHRLARSLSGDLDTIALKTLAKPPTERYATVAALADDLQRHIEGRPVLARRASAWYRISKFVARYRWPVAITAAAAAVLVATAAIAVVQAQLAFTEARKASAVKDFLLDVLSSADPALSMDKPARDMTVQQALDGASRRIGTALDDQPDVKISVLSTLGTVYSSLDLPDRSLALTKEALALSERYYGVPHPSQAELTASIANDEVFAGRFDDARLWLDRSEKLFNRLGDTSSVSFGQMLKLKGNLLRYEGTKQFPAARRVLEQAAALFRERYPQNEGRLGTLFVLAHVLNGLDAPDEAERIADEAVQIAAGSNRPGFGVPNAFSLRAVTREGNGDLRGAESDYKSAATAYRKSAGEAHFLTLQNDSSLGLTLLQLGEREGGLRLLEASATALAKVRAGSNTHVAAISRLGNGYMMLGDFERAVPILDQSRAIWQQRNDSLQRTGPTVSLAAAFTSLGRYKEARELLDEALAIRREREHRAVLPLAQVHLMLGRLALDQRQFDEAKSQFETAIELSPAQTKTDLIRQVLARAGLALVAESEGNGEVALKAGEEALVIAHHARVRQHVGVVAIGLEAKGRSLCRYGSATEGESLLADAFALKKAAVDPASPMLASTGLARATCLLRLQRIADARAEFDGARTILVAKGEVAPHFAEELRTLQRELQITALSR